MSSPYKIQGVLGCWGNWTFVLQVPSSIEATSRFGKCILSADTPIRPAPLQAPGFWGSGNWIRSAGSCRAANVKPQISKATKRGTPEDKDQRNRAGQVKMGGECVAQVLTATKQVPLKQGKTQQTQERGSFGSVNWFVCPAGPPSLPKRKKQKHRPSPRICSPGKFVGAVHSKVKVLPPK